MSKMSILFLALVGAALSGLPAAAAAPNATQQEADRLRGVFQRYVGGPAPDGAGSVTVAPEGAAYRASFDLQQMTRPFEDLGVTVEAATQSFVLAPNDDGTWHVTSDAMPPLVIHLKDQTITMKTSTYRFEGTYDPKLGLFLDQRMTQDGATTDQEAPALAQHRRSGHVVLSQKAAPVDGGRADVDIHSGVSDVTGQMTMRSPPPKASVAVEPTSPPLDISYTLPAATVDLHMDRLRAWSLLDLWAFFVAHPNREAITASQEDLRALLKAALPIVGGLKEGGSLEGLSIQTQAGEIKVGKMAGSLDVADLAGAGRVASVLSIDGLTLPSSTLPPWATGLLPTALDLSYSATGSNIDAAAREAVEDFDLKHDGLTPEQSEKIGHIFWPGEGKVVLAPSRIASPLLEIKLEGEASISPVPAGHLDVTGTGLDKAIAALQAVAATDASAGQVLAQFVMAKNLAKQNPDGSYLWAIEAGANGPLTVNGIPLK